MCAKSMCGLWEILCGWTAKSEERRANEESSIKCRRATPHYGATKSHSPSSGNVENNQGGLKYFGIDPSSRTLDSSKHAAANYPTYLTRLWRRLRGSMAENDQEQTPYEENR